MNDLMDLQTRLEMVAERVAFPPEPDLATSVRAALAANPSSVHLGAYKTPKRTLGVPRARWAPALAVLLLAVLAVALSPTTRDAIADWIGLDGGLRIEFGEPPAEPLGTDLRLGEETTLEAAVERAGFEIASPVLLGNPDEVYLTRDGTRISLVYEAGPGLPRTPTTRVGALLGAFRATLGDETILKKVIAGGTGVERIEVNGAPGYWIAGDAHALFYIDEDGQFTEDLARLAGNTLAWERDGIVYRLETALNKERSLEIARSVP